jgi:hypothetical protein
LWWLLVRTQTLFLRHIYLAWRFGSTSIASLAVVVVGCCGNSLPPAVQASSRFPDLSSSFYGSPSIADPQGSCDGAASSPLGGWSRFWVLLDSGHLPPRRRVGVFESCGFSLRIQCCSMLVLLFLFLNPRGYFLVGALDSLICFVGTIFSIPCC